MSKTTSSRRDHLDFSERTTSLVSFVLDECIPPILRDRRWFYGPIARTYSRTLDLDFKQKAPTMTNEEFQAAYEKQPIRHCSDMTPATTKFVLDSLVGETVADIGSGTGAISMECAKLGHRVTAVDVSNNKLESVGEIARKAGLDIATQWANVESLPFEDNSFDTTICLHVLEHVRDLVQAINELKRVTKRRLVIVVPRERYHRYTCNYHLNFFGDPEQLMLAVKIPDSTCQVIDRCNCYAGNIDDN